ncbi:MAG: cob(I)yrinic acid a,c-diamide adenosyltransferase [bacterium]
MRKGLTQIYTGEGKGKTTAAIGQIIRALGRGLTVCLVQFLKPGSSGELSPLRKLGIRVIQSQQRYRFPHPTEEERSRVKSEINSLLQEVNRLLTGRQYDVIVLDEINNCLHLGLVEPEVILDLISQKPDKVELILTGRYAPAEVMERADLVTEMVPLKHPYDQGIPAREGIEY